MEPFWIMMDMVSGAAREEDEKTADPSYVQCLNCRGYVAKKKVRERGHCYLCGMSGEEIAKTVRQRREARAKETPYRTKCPNCGALVVTKMLREKGCYVCRWSPPAEEEADKD